MVDQEKLVARLIVLEQNQSTPKASDNVCDKARISKPFTCSECRSKFKFYSDNN